MTEEFRPFDPRPYERVQQLPVARAGQAAESPVRFRLLYPDDVVMGEFSVGVPAGLVLSGVSFGGEGPERWAVQFRFAPPGAGGQP